MTQASNGAAERFCTACTPSRCRRVVKSAHNLRNRNAMPHAPDTRERSDSTELVLYAPWCGLLPRHPLLSSYFLTLAVEPRVVTDCVPIVHSYMQPLQLLKSACVCKDWTEIAARDCYWERLVRRDYAVDADDLRPPPRPVKQLWLAMRRAFRAVVRSEGAMPPMPMRGDLPAVSRGAVAH